MFSLLPVQVYITAGQSYELETKLRKLEQSAKNRFGGTTDSELSELEDVVALTAARVQSAESEVGPGSVGTGPGHNKAVGFQRLSIIQLHGCSGLTASSVSSCHQFSSLTV